MITMRFHYYIAFESVNSLPIVREDLLHVSINGKHLELFVLVLVCQAKFPSGKIID